ncbi:8-kd dynein light chain, DLC8, pin, partial [Earliella scabrosa]
EVIIKNVDMSEEMQQEAVYVASSPLEKYHGERDIAAQIKFNGRHRLSGRVVVGKNIDSYV